MSDTPREAFDRAWGFRHETRSRAEADAAYHWFRLGWDERDRYQQNRSER